MTVVSAVQNAKAHGPTAVTEAGMWRWVMAAHPLNADHSMHVSVACKPNQPTNQPTNQPIINETWFKFVCSGIETCFGWETQHQRCRVPGANRISNQECWRHFETLTRAMLYDYCGRQFTKVAML